MACLMFTSANLEAAALNTWQHHLKTIQQLGDAWAVRFGIFSAATCCKFMLFALTGSPCDQNCQTPSLLILGLDRARIAAIRQSHPLQVKMTNDVGSISSGTYYSSANCGPFFGSPVWRDIRACPAFKHLTGCHMPSWAQRKVKAIHQNSSCQSMSVLHILFVEMDRFLPTPATFPLSIHVKKYRKCSMEDCCYSSWLGWKMAAHDGSCWLYLGIGCEMHKFIES